VSFKTYMTIVLPVIDFLKTVIFLRFNCGLCISVDFLKQPRFYAQESECFKY